MVSGVAATWLDAPLLASSGLALFQCLERADQTEQLLALFASDLRLGLDSLYRLCAAEHIFAHLPKVKVRSIPIVH